jgi:hypothetical protein
LRERRPAREDRPAVPARVVDQLLHARELRRGVDRAELRVGLEAAADLHLPRDLGERVDDGPVHILVHVEALDRDAHLSRVREGAPEEPRRDLRRVDVAEHDGRVVAAELERHALQVVRRGAHDLLPGRDAAGERYLPDRGMRRHPGAHLVAPAEHVEHAGRQRLAKRRADRQRGERVTGEGFATTVLPVRSAGPSS